MKYNHGKIKREHGILKDFHKILKKLAEEERVDRLIPWRISRQQKSTSDFRLTFQYMTTAGCKMLMKKWATVQELFVICDTTVESDVIKKWCKKAI